MDANRFKDCFKAIREWKQQFIVTDMKKRQASDADLDAISTEQLDGLTLGCVWSANTRKNGIIKCLQVDFNLSKDGATLLADSIYDACQ